MYRQNQTLVRLLQPPVTALGYELLGIEELREGRTALVRIYIDSETGITLDDCERVSEQVTGVLDVEDPVRGPYRLEVSSPGLDRPLFTLDQCRHYLGWNVRVRLRSKVQGRRKFTGRLLDVQDDSLVIDEDDVSYTVPADLVDRANLVAEI